jgi:hypothetical protein
VVSPTLKKKIIISEAPGSQSIESFEPNLSDVSSELEATEGLTNQISN